MTHITFLGTSHIAEQSVNAITKAVEETKPDIIAVELDRQRLHALLSNQKPSYSPRIIKHVGISGYLFAVIGSYFQQKLGRAVGMRPGADMKAAADLARQHQLPLLLLDQDIQVTLRKLSHTLTKKEKRRFLSDLLFGRWKKQPKIRIDLKKVPEAKLITTLLEQLKDRYPSFHKVLVEDRNHYMARKLAAAALQEQDKRILVIVGAGHLNGLRRAFEETITLLRRRAKEGA
ncbi:TraB/GumN family protein [Candidatus Woesearchaeota archaeon]|nr:TraB/GumN family protein [Candidatus Woesearchaeota archaeon]